MLAQTWTLWGFDCVGASLTLSRLLPWVLGVGAAVPTNIAATNAPAFGALSDLLEDNDNTCSFTADTIRTPGFAITLNFSTPVELCGVRFAGPSESTWPVTHSLAAGVVGQTLRKPKFNGPFILSPSPTTPLNEGLPLGVVYRFAGARTHRGVALSRDGRVVAAAYNTGVIISDDGGETWPKSAALATTRGCAMSGDGQYIIAVSNTVGAIMSSDGGSTWAPIAALGAVAMYACAMSDSGADIVVTVSNSARVSHDYGATWVSTSGFSGSFNNCGMSSDGQVILLAPNGSAARCSRDGGTTWFAVVGTASYVGAAVSGDGNTLMLGVGSSGYYISKDNAGAWAQNTNVYANSCALSFDGRTAAVGGQGGTISITTDQGGNWQGQYAGFSAAVNYTAVSANGHCIAAAAGTAAQVACYRIPDTIYTPVLTTRGPVEADPWVTALVGPQELGPITSVGASLIRDTEFGGNGRVYGTVARKNTPANVPMRRRVRLHRSRDGLLVSETWSNADGTYEFNGINMQYEYDTIAWDNEMSYRSVVANNLKPEAM